METVAANMKTKLWYLKRINLFSEMSEAEMKQLEGITRMEAVKRKKPIYLPGDSGDSIFLLKSGKVKISKISEDGREITLAILEPGEIFGELEALDGSPRDTIAEALDDTYICVIKREDFESLLKRKPDLSFKLTKLIGFRLKKIENRIEELVFKDVPARLAHLLLDFSKKFGVKEGEGVSIGVRITHKEIANLIGSTRETVSMTLGEFKRQGFIAMEGKKILILKEDGLSLMGSTEPYFNNRVKK